VRAEILSIHSLTSNGRVLLAQVICQPIAALSFFQLSVDVYASPATDAVALNPLTTELLTRSEAARPASRQRLTCAAR